ncbi:MAG: hypothetical protein Q8O34_16875 [Rhodocyclaceae bacterium]|nr:hypothetical protein [Rhodocyclaceae bacterium]
MKALLQALLRAIARFAASEAGELLSARREAHLLQSQMYSRIGREHALTSEHKVAPLSATRCQGARRTNDLPGHCHLHQRIRRTP